MVMKRENLSQLPTDLEAMNKRLNAALDAGQSRSGVRTVLLSLHDLRTCLTELARLRAQREPLIKSCEWALRRNSHNNCGNYAENPDPTHCWECSMAYAIRAYQR
jgi:hypothetical protein